MNRETSGHYYKDLDGVKGHGEAHSMPMPHQELLCWMGIFFCISTPYDKIKLFFNMKDEVGY